jgi:hypothetical protein
MTSYHWNISAPGHEDENESDESIMADSTDGKSPFNNIKIDRPTNVSTPKNRFVNNGLEYSLSGHSHQNINKLEKKKCLVIRPVKLTTRITKTKKKSKKKTSYSAVHPEEISRKDILEEIDFNQIDDDKFHEDIILKV